VGINTLLRASFPHGPFVATTKGNFTYLHLNKLHSVLA
jgi:hypothetical protein